MMKVCLRRFSGVSPSRKMALLPLRYLWEQGRALRPSSSEAERLGRMEANSIIARQLSAHFHS